MAEEIASERRVLRRHPLLGTVVEVATVGGTDHETRRVGAAVFDDIDRLEQRLSAHRHDSELSAWKRDDVGTLSTELCEVMSTSLDWQQRSGGAFNPLTGELSAVWAAAERLGKPPSADELSQVSAAIREPRYEMRNGVPVPLGDCSHLNFNAIAKGFIVDRTIGHVDLPDGVVSLVVSAGGDLAHRGERAARVGIENPLRPFDNEPPIDHVEVRNAGLATSGGARRGFRIAGRRFSHVIDPLTGWPVDRQASVSIVAPSAMRADVLATVVGALSPSEAVSRIEAEPDSGCLVVGPAGDVVKDSTWVRLACTQR